MKNFPHQYNDFTKLRGTLETIRDLNQRGEDLGDDGILGYELARRGIYTFRGLDGPLEDRIAEEQLKPPGSQGPRTAAREMRRTLRHLGWLDEDWSLTSEGQALLESAAGSEQERSLWQQALLELELEVDGETSHPVRILLRLIADHEIVERQGTELALEARDDSEQEYRRISALVHLPEQGRREGIQATEYQVANARKILPSFAEQANLIHRSSQAAPYTLTEAGRAALGEGFDARAVEVRPELRSRRPARRRGMPRRTRAGTVTPPAGGDPEGWASLSAEEQIAATRLRFERTVRHQDLLAQLVELLEAEGVKLYEDSSAFDLLYVPADSDQALTIFEIKTLEADELTQTRLAVGQLLTYEHLNVRPRWPGRDVQRMVIYDREVDGELIAFLDAVGIGAFAVSEGELVALNDHASESGFAAA